MFIIVENWSSFIFNCGNQRHQKKVACSQHNCQTEKKIYTGFHRAHQFRTISFESNSVKYRQKIKIPNQKSIIILLYFDSFRLVHDLSELFQPLYIVLFLWSISEISGTLLLIQVEVSTKFKLISMKIIQSIYGAESKLRTPQMLVKKYNTKRKKE